jgi:hypothetical protein
VTTPRVRQYSLGRKKGRLNFRYIFTAAGPCTVTVDTVHLANTRTCTITASQSGTGAYDAAPPVTRLFTIAWPLSFTDDPITARGTTVKTAHISEMRLRIDSLRMCYSLPPFAWADPTLTGGATAIRAVHVTELRAALDDVYAAAGLSAPTYSDDHLSSGATVIKAADIAELRAAILAI